MEKIRILLADDQVLFLESIKLLLSSQKDFDVIGEGRDGEEVLKKVEKYRPDLVLMDIRMPKLNGIQATEFITKNYPDCRVLVLSTFSEDEDVFAALRFGACGYLLKDMESEGLFQSIRVAARGGSVLHSNITPKIVQQLSRAKKDVRAANQSLVEPLSHRELEVLNFLADGCSNKEIASQLSLVEGTVKNHVSSILGKLGVADRSQAILRAQELGLV